MPYRPEAELKRPDLKGEFLCGHCGKTFCHAASLNRHRLNFHGDDQQCQLCNVKIAAHETVRRHMAVNHQITRVFTCGCCNWTFPDKKELHAHNNSMLRTGQPGEARAIAISNRTPGSLAQAELRTDECASPSTGRAPSSAHKQQRKPMEGNNMVDMFYKQMLSQSSGVVSALSPEWMSTFLMNNPSLLSMLNAVQANTMAAAEPVKQEEPSTSALESLFFNNNNNNNNLVGTEKTYEEIKVKTESDEAVSSGPESGIASGEEAVDPSPVPSSSSKESSPMTNEASSTKSSSRKRKSVDAIASFLFNRKQSTPAHV